MAIPNFKIKIFIANNNSNFQGIELYFGNFLKHHGNLQVIHTIE